MTRPPRLASDRLHAFGTSRLVRVLAWLALLGATGWLLRGERLRAGSPEGVRAFVDLTYRAVEGRRARLDVYVPDASATRPAAGWPVLVAVHGGGWRGGSKTDYGRSLAPLVRRGLVVVAVDYRLSRPGEPSWPDNLDDVRAAVRWVGRHASEYAIDADRLAVIGASAGGHLALMLGVSGGGGPSPVRAVIDFYGPTDLRALYERRTSADRAVGLLLGGPPESVPARYDAASPLRLVAAGAAPTLIIHGQDDALVPLDQSRALAAALRDAGAPCRLLTLAGERHGFGLRAGTRDLVPEILDFLETAWRRPAR